MAYSRAGVHVPTSVVVAKVVGLLEMALFPPVPVTREVWTLFQHLRQEDQPRVHESPHLFQLGAGLLSCRWLLSCTRSRLGAITSVMRSQDIN